LKEILGNLELNRLYQFDCIEAMRLLPSESIDLVVTDPPYGIKYYSNWSKDKEYRDKVSTVNGIKNDENNIDFLELVATELFRLLKNNTHLYWFTRWDKVEEQKPMLERVGFKVKNNIIWMKNNWSMGDLKGAYAGQYECILFCQKGRRELNEVDGKKRHTDILQFDRIPPNKLLHSHQKPTDLLELLIKKSSSENEIVLDPFMGCGSTAVAASITHRKWIGFELEPKYIEISNTRLDDLESTN
jgi:DNA modification methylase